MLLHTGPHAQLGQFGRLAVFGVGARDYGEKQTTVFFVMEYDYDPYFQEHLEKELRASGLCTSHQVIFPITAKEKTKIFFSRTAWGKMRSLHRFLHATSTRLLRAIKRAEADYKDALWQDEEAINCDEEFTQLGYLGTLKLRD